MQQGDQYSICVTIDKDGAALTPADVEGVRVRIGEIERRYPDGGLEYNAEAGVWLFPVTQADTLSMSGTPKAQVQVNFGGTPAQIVGSPVGHVAIDDSVIREVWPND